MSFKCLLRAHYYGKKKNKEKKMVSGNLQLAFFTDKIRLGIAVYSEMVFFMLKRNVLAIIVTFVYLISWSNDSVLITE